MNVLRCSNCPTLPYVDVRQSSNGVLDYTRTLHSELPFSTVWALGLFNDAVSFDYYMTKNAVSDE